MSLSCSLMERSAASRLKLWRLWPTALLWSRQHMRVVEEGEELFCAVTQGPLSHIKEG